jgi:hypothetical protein
MNSGTHIEADIYRVRKQINETANASARALLLIPDRELRRLAGHQI